MFQTSRTPILNSLLEVAMSDSWKNRSLDSDLSDKEAVDKNGLEKAGTGFIR